MNIGAQLYTLRNSCTTLDDFSQTLKRVADMGYKYVQVSGTCDYDPAWLKEQLDSNGLKCVITHTPAAALKGDILSVAKNHDVFDCKYVGLGMANFLNGDVGENLGNFIKEYTPIADALAQQGKYFMYHNHAYEFEKYNGKLLLEHLAENFSADKMGFTLDVYWVQVGGADPAYWIENLKGRVPCIHLKDCAYGPKMAAIGDGNINFERIFSAAQAAGTEYMLVEQDNCYDLDPFDCLKRSYDYLKARGFE